jgi:hypothetical protein
MYTLTNQRKLDIFLRQRPMCWLCWGSILLIWLNIKSAQCRKETDSGSLSRLGNPPGWVEGPTNLQALPHRYMHTILIRVCNVISLGHSLVSTPMSRLHSATSVHSYMPVIRLTSFLYTPIPCPRDILIFFLFFFLNQWNAPFQGILNSCCVLLVSSVVAWEPSSFILSHH